MGASNNFTTNSASSSFFLVNGVFFIEMLADCCSVMKNDK